MMTPTFNPVDAQTLVKKGLPEGIGQDDIYIEMEIMDEEFKSIIEHEVF